MEQAYSALPWIGVVLSFFATLYCWRQIWSSDDHWFFKVSSVLISAIPLFGPFLYAFLEMPVANRDAPREPKPQLTRMLRYWNAHEHIYLSCAALIFVSLGVLAWWLHGWTPGRLYETVIGTITTDVSSTHYVLLIIAVLIFGYIDRRKKFYRRMKGYPGTGAENDTQFNDEKKHASPPLSAVGKHRKKKHA